MVLKKMLKEAAGDPEDIKTGYAGEVWDIVKMSTLLGAFVAFMAGMILKGKLLMLAAESWTAILIVMAIFFVALFGSMAAVFFQTIGLIRKKSQYSEAAEVSDGRVALWTYLSFVAAWSSTFFFALTSDVTAEALRGFGMGEYLYDFPAALVFFYVAGPAIIVNVAMGTWTRGSIAKALKHH